MAYINFGSGFNITSTDAVDKRLVMTKAEMLAIKKAKMPDIYFTLCSDDSQFYVYNKSKTPSTETGYYELANKDILDSLATIAGEIEDINDAIDAINARLASEFVTKTQLSGELPGAIAQAMTDPSTKTQMEQAVGKAIPGALKDALEKQTEDSGLVVDADGNIKVQLNQEHLQIIDNKIDLSLSLIQAIGDTE